MADTWQILCVNKTPRNDPHDRIRNVGGVHNGERWKIAQETAIEGMENGKWRFFVSVNGDSVWVIIAERNGRKYLKTQNDGDQPNNLLSLPECL